MTNHIEAGNYIEGSGFHGIRVVVTGMGAVTPLGENIPETWAGLVAGRSGVGLIDPPFNGKVHFAARIQNFVPPSIFEHKEIRSSVHLSALYSTAAFLEARMDAGLPVDTVNLAEIVGVRIGSGVAGASFIAEMEDAFIKGGDRSVPTKSILKILLERVASVVGMKGKITGPTASSVAACATGNQNIIDALRIITSGDAHIMYAGATEGPVEKIGMSAFAQARALSTRNDDPQAASRPFDENSDGFVMSEGATVLALEELNHALERGAHIYGEIIGYGETADAYNDVFPDGIGSEGVMRRALQKANLCPQQINYVNAHGTSTAGDRIESEALFRIFKDCNPRPLVSSTKSMTGHMLGAAGALEAMVCLMAIEKGIVPPTINLQSPINDYFDYVPNKARETVIDTAMSTSFGFGGLNTGIIFKKYSP